MILTYRHRYAGTAIHVNMIDLDRQSALHDAIEQGETLVGLLNYATGTESAAE